MQKKRRKSRALSPAEHVRRGTVQPCRARTTTKKRRHQSVTGIEQPRDFIAMLDAYLAGIASGTTVAGEWMKKAAARFVRMREQSRDLTCHYTFSPDTVIDICRFV